MSTAALQLQHSEILLCVNQWRHESDCTYTNDIFTSRQGKQTIYITSPFKCHQQHNILMRVDRDLFTVNRAYSPVSFMPAYTRFGSVQKSCPHCILSNQYAQYRQTYTDKTSCWPDCKYALIGRPKLLEGYLKATGYENTRRILLCEDMVE
jgi:hypothetical protein